MNLDSSFERIISANCVGQSPDLLTFIEKTVSNPASGVSEGSGDHVQFVRHASTSNL